MLAAPEPEVGVLTVIVAATEVVLVVIRDWPFCSNASDDEVKVPLLSPAMEIVPENVPLPMFPLSLIAPLLLRQMFPVIGVLPASIPPEITYNEPEVLVKETFPEPDAVAAIFTPSVDVM